MNLRDSLPVLNVATPCQADWNQMKGDDRARFCQHCHKHVYNLSALSAAAAADLIREKEGKLCIRFYRRADGTILHGEDCPVGLVARQWRRVKSRLAAAASFAILALGLGRAAASTPSRGSATPSPSPTPPIGVMGDYCPAPTPKPSPSPSK